MGTEGGPAAQATTARSSRAWALSSSALVWAALYLVFFLLLALSAVERLTRPVPAGVTLEPLAPLSSNVALIQGRTRPHAALQAGVDDGGSELHFARDDGTFRIELQVARASDRLWVRALSTDGEELGSASARVEWKPGAFPPHLDLCLISEAQRLIWIAGTGTPHESFSLEPPLHSAYVYTDDSGTVDELIPLGETPPESLVLVDDGPPAVRSSPLPCRALGPSELLPVARQTTVTERPDLLPALERLAAASARDRRATEQAFFAEVLPDVHVELRLPARHPYFQAVASGELSAAKLVRNTVGDIGPLTDRWLLNELSRQGESGDGQAQAQLAPRTRIRLQGDVGQVEVTGRLFSLSGGSGEVRLAPARNGIAARPLLSAVDSFEVRPVGGDLWRYRPPPDAAGATGVSWRGPRDLDEISASRSLPAEMVNALRLADREREKTQQPQTMRDLARTVDRPERWNPGLVAWKTLLALVPAAAVAWLLRRRGAYATLPGTPALLAFTVVVAVVLFWPQATALTHDVLSRVPGGAFLRALFDVASRHEHSAERSAEVGRLIDLPRHAGWLLFVALAGALPFYFRRLVTALRGRAAHERGEPSRRRRAWLLALALPLVLYSIGVLVLVWDGTHESSRVLLDEDWADVLVSNTAALAERVPAGILPLFLLSGLLFNAGLRGLLFAAGYGLASWLVVAQGRGALDLGRWSGPTALAVAALAAVPLLARLFAAAVPVGWPARSRWLLALASSVLCVTVQAAPARPVLAIVSGLVGMGLLWATATSYGALAPARTLGAWIADRPRLAALLFFAAGAALGWPVAAPSDPLRLGDVANLVHHWTTVLPYLLALGVALLVLEHMTFVERALLSREELSAGAVLYTVFLVTPVTTWLLVPVPLLVAFTLARHWLFVVPAGHWDARTPATEAVSAWRARLRALLDGERRSGRAEAAMRALDKELEGAKLSPTDYDERRRPYAEMAASARSASAEDPRVAFAVGDPQLGERVGAFVRTGLLIASASILISLYEYLPAKGVNYPFPVADFLTFLLAAILKWGLYAAFFGIFFANLRGETGLAKGLHLFVAVATPFAVYRLLDAPSADELRSFLFWLAQLFVFFGALGLLAGDLRLLRLAGLGANDLRSVHRMPALYAFLSAVAAAIVPSVLAVVGGRVGDLVKFFMQLVTGPAG